MTEWEWAFDFEGGWTIYRDHHAWEWGRKETHDEAVSHAGCLLDVYREAPRG